MTALIDYDRLCELFGKGGIEVTQEQYDRLLRYCELLVEWNRKMNLTAITEPMDIAVKHLFDSIFPFMLENVEKGCSMIDVGTGAGLPGVPIRIMREDIKLTLLDGLGKRVNFLKTVSDELSLEARCIHGRAEELARAGAEGGLRESFDVATVRAVAALNVLCEICLPYVRVGGSFIALKGRDGLDELRAAERAIKLLGGEVDRAEKYKLTSGDERTLIVIRKARETAEKYPRGWGQIKKRAL